MTKYPVPPEKALSKHDNYVYAGYLDLLEKASPNGAHVHAVKQKITALRFCVEIGLNLSPQSIEEIKDLIRKLYPNTLDKGP